VSIQAADNKHETRMQRLQQLLDSGALKQSGHLLNSLRPGEIAHLLEGLPIAEREIVWNLVNEENDGEVLMELADDVRASLISQMKQDEVVAVSEGLDTDDRPT
jgi:magnesium transporter